MNFCSLLHLPLTRNHPSTLQRLSLSPLYTTPATNHFPHPPYLLEKPSSFRASKNHQAAAPSSFLTISPVPFPFTFLPRPTSLPAFPKNSSMAGYQSALPLPHLPHPLTSRLNHQIPNSLRSPQNHHNSGASGGSHRDVLVGIRIIE